VALHRGDLPAEHQVHNRRGGEGAAQLLLFQLGRPALVVQREQEQVFRQTLSFRKGHTA